MASSKVLELARVLWDYHTIRPQLPRAVDLLLVTGSHDDRVAECGAQLYKRIDVKFVVASGGFGKITATTHAEPEAERFKRIMEMNGVPSDTVLTEVTASNTGDNVTRTRSLLEEKGVEAKTAVIVSKPYMSRRALATAQKQWPEPTWWVASPEIEFDHYPTEDVPEQRMIELMVGDLQRIKLYGDRGFQTPQEIPDHVWTAYEKLIELGYDRQVIKE